MKWKILIGLDIAFSTLAIIAAGVLGNSVMVSHIPTLHDNSTWLSRLVMTSLTAPDALADEALGALPTISILLFFALFFAGESLLVLLTPLVDRVLAVRAAHGLQQDVCSTDRDLLGTRGTIGSLRRRIMRRVVLRLSAMSLLAFTVGLAAGALAWGAALLINANTGGVIQTLAIVAGIVVILLVCEVLKEVVPSVVEEEADSSARFGELTRDPALSFRRKVQRPWRMVVVVVFIVAGIVVVWRHVRPPREAAVKEIEDQASRSQPATALSNPTAVTQVGAQAAPEPNHFLTQITDPEIAASLTRQIRKVSLDRDPIVVVSLTGERAWINLKGTNVALPLVSLEGLAANTDTGNIFSRRFKKDGISLLIQYEVLRTFVIQDMGCTRTEYRLSIELSSSQGKEHIEPESYGEGC